MQVGQTEKNIYFVLPFFVIFAVILPYASKDAWWEAVFSGIILSGAGFLYLQKRFDAKLFSSRIFLPLYVLSFYCLVQGIATVFVNQEIISRSFFIPESADAAASLWNALKIVALAVFTKILLRGLQRNFRAGVFLLILIGSFYAAFGILRFALQTKYPQLFAYFILPNLQPGIGFGTFENQNHFAFLMLLNFGLCLGLLLNAFLRKETRFIVGVGGLISWIAIILTASRGAIVSSFVTVGAVFLFSFHDYRKNGEGESKKTLLKKFAESGKGFLLLAVLTGTLFSGVIYIGQNRVVQRFEIIYRQFESAGNFGTFRRIDVWKAALEMIRENWLFGVGFGGFRYEVSKYIEISGTERPLQAHNDYLELLASGGIPALLCGAVFACLLWRKTRDGLENCEDNFEFAAKIGAIGALSGVAVHSLFDFGLQLFANQLYVCALLSILLFKSANDMAETIYRVRAAEKRIACALLCFLSGIIAFYGGAAKYETRRGAQCDFLQIPFDADFYRAKARTETAQGNLVAAGDYLTEAVRNRPGDYELRLEKARVAELLERFDEAESAYLEARNLAPFYGEPTYLYGNFLLRQKRQNEALRQVRIASRQNSFYFEDVLNIFWQASNANAKEMINRLAPFEGLEKERLAAFLFEKKDFGEVSALMCSEAESSASSRDGLITKLFEKRKFLYASQVFTQNCETENLEKGTLLDGNFSEDDLAQGRGFGWRIGDLPENVEVGFVEKNGIQEKSLLFVFDGDYPSATPLLSQTIVVEAGQKYTLRFKYRTREIKTGGMPILQILLKSSASDFKSNEVELSPTDEWKNVTSEIVTDDATEALEIRLTRYTCSEKNCPIFGRLILDAFSLEKDKSFKINKNSVKKNNLPQ